VEKQIFIFELFDRVSGPLRAVTGTAGRLGRTLSDGLAATGYAVGGTMLRLRQSIADELGLAHGVARTLGGRIAESIRGADAAFWGTVDSARRWGAGIRDAVGARFEAARATLRGHVGRMADEVRSLAPRTFDAFGKFGEGIASLGKGARGAATDAIAALGGWAAIGGAALAAASKIYDAVEASVKLASHQETARIALTARLGGPKATEVTTRSTAFAKQTPFDTAAVTGWYAQLVEQGRSFDEVERILTAAADVSGRSGFDPKVMDNLVAAFAAGKPNAKLDLGALKDAGLPKDVLEQLKKTAGGSASVETVLAAVQSRVSGGKLGSVMAQGAGSAEGMFTRLQSLSQQMFAGLDQQPGFKVFKDFLSNLVNLLDPASASGQALRDVFFGFFNGAMGLLQGFTGDEGLGKMKGLLEILTTVAQGLGLVFQVVFAVLGALIEPAYQGILILWGGFEQLGEGIGFVAFKIWEAWQAISDFFAKVSGIAASMWQLGQQLVQGLVDGIMSSLGAVGESLTKLGDTVIGGLKSILGIHSPSTVFRQLGVYTVAGFEQGLTQGAGDAGAALTALTDVSPAPRVGSALGAARPNVNITVNASGEGARDIAERVRAATIEALQSAFEQLALEQGVA
jgi:hypothetical protein